jgi:hypothetical protein
VVLTLRRQSSASILLKLMKDSTTSS